MIASEFVEFYFGIINGGILSEILSFIFNVLIFKIKFNIINSFQNNF